MIGYTGAFARRVAAVRARAAHLGLDGLLITHLANIRYLSGFSGSNAGLLLDGDRAIFATDARYEERATRELTAGECELIIVRNGLLGELAKRAADAHAGGKVGFEGSHLSYSDWKELSERAGSVEWESASDVVEELRAVKDEDEQAAIEEAAAIAGRALEETLEMARPGVSERDIAAELDYRMARAGAEGPAFETIVAAGSRSALPHAQASENKLSEGDLLLVDFGARWNGYCSDITRTFVLGSPSQRQVEVYEAVLEAQEAAAAALGEGIPASRVDAAAREALARRELGGQFPHSTGHGLGLEVHEGPRLHTRSEERLRRNMVVTVEPGLYFQGWGGVRIEDDLVIGSGGPRSLVKLPKAQLPSLPL